MTPNKYTRRSFIAGAAAATGALILGTNKVSALTAPNLDAWLASNLPVRNAIRWVLQSKTGKLETIDYQAWTTDKKIALQAAFEKAYNKLPTGLPEVPQNLSSNKPDAYPATVIPPAEAWNFYMAGIAQSLAVEIGKRVPWTIAGYSDEELGVLFDASNIFGWDAGLQGYRVRANQNGYYTPAPPDMIWNFFVQLGVVQANNMILNLPKPSVTPPPAKIIVPIKPIYLPTNTYSSRQRAVARLFDWARVNLKHSSKVTAVADSVENFNAFWQYGGFPPIARVIKGTTVAVNPQPNWASGINHWTHGCIGTSGFLAGTLRTINIPVKLVQVCSHSQPYFIADKAYLSHGDDLYDSFTRYSANKADTIQSERLFMPEAKYQQWFAASNADRCKNVGKWTAQVTVEDLPKYLVALYCQDKAAGLAKDKGKVYGMLKDYYSMAELDALQFWQRIDEKSKTVCK